MKTKRITFFFLIIVELSCRSQTKKINGISFVASKDTISTEHISPVVEIQGNYVALMPFGFVSDLSSPKIIYNSKKQWFTSFLQLILERRMVCSRF